MVGYGLTRRRRRAHQAKQQIASARERFTDAFGEDGKVLARALSNEKPSVFESTSQMAGRPRAS